MDELKKLTQRYNELIVQLRSAREEENPDKTKLLNLEEEIRSLVSQIETERAIARMNGINPEGRMVKPGDHSNASEEEMRAAILDYMRTGNQVNLRTMTSGMTTGGDTGGFLIPQEWENQILEKEKEQFIMRQICDVQASSVDHNIPVADDYGESGWIDENGNYPESDAKFKNIIMQAWKVGRISKISEELLLDNAYNLEQWLINTMAYTNGLAAEKAFIAGDGNKKPRGVLIDADSVSAASAAIKYEDYIKLFESIKAGYFTRAAWLMNANTLAATMALKDGAGRYIYQPFTNNAIANAPMGTLLNKPIYLSSEMPDVGTGKKPVLLGDFKRYRIQDRLGFWVQRLNELYAEKGLIGFKGTQRTDGKLLISEAVKALTMPGTVP